MYASKLPSHFIRDIVKTKNKSTKRGMNTISQRDVLIEQSLRPYMKPSSPIKPYIILYSDSFKIKNFLYQTDNFLFYFSAFITFAFYGIILLLETTKVLQGGI